MEPRILDSFKDLITIIRPNKVVEFGSWKGQSAVAFLTLARNAGLDTEILCVDTWLGSSEHWNNRYPDGEFSFKSLGLQNGEPSILDDFRKMITDYGFYRQVSILRCPSQFSGAFLSSCWSDANLIYLDADHSVRAVLADLEVCSRSMPHGVLSGDDFSWKSVRLALVSFMMKQALAGTTRRLYVSENSNTWVLLNGDRRRIEQFLSRGWKRSRMLPLIVSTGISWISNQLGNIPAVLKNGRIGSRSTSRLQ
jgi:hypothetical protein